MAAMVQHGLGWLTRGPTVVPEPQQAPNRAGPIVIAGMMLGTTTALMQHGGPGSRALWPTELARQLGSLAPSRRVIWAAASWSGSVPEVALPALPALRSRREQPPAGELAVMTR